MSMKRIEPTPEFFQGAVSFRTGDGWVQPFRLREDILPLYWSERLIFHAYAQAGTRLRLATDADTIGLDVQQHDEQRVFDVTVDGELVGSVRQPAGETRVVFDDLPAGQKVVELWLPQRRPCRVDGVLVPLGAAAGAVDDPRPRWVTYGSSITHCGEAHSPARTWPAIVARRHGLNLTCLGFGGECQIEPLLATTIRDLPADIISLKLGINVYGGPNLGGRTFGPAAIGMVRILREKHPQIPILVISPIISPPRENEPGGGGLSIRDMRRELEKAVSLLRDAGDANVHYFDGRTLFGDDLAGEYMPDDLHPNGDGYEIMGEQFSRAVMQQFFPCGCS